ncbi:hypothetical protein C8Q69DRAFT_29709 [Paecilomyces variotii]|uniref:Secreted protein n=1 Tax=Byssochlamys spectabilis TaxID=264951 RepID=A0A443I696_BYSSP|nr:hypothetical protein C8Q69DRAFT_29709 [Paecilomyces variotii]RWQ99572.1 hypothetical protein C8Q69DRAFT_29709 [Paecilomyces variotii]
MVSSIVCLWVSVATSLGPVELLGYRTTKFNRDLHQLVRFPYGSTALRLVYRKNSSETGTVNKVVQICRCSRLQLLPSSTASTAPDHRSFN